MSIRNRQKVSNNKMKKSANKTAYIDLWLTLNGEPYNDGVTATQLPNGKWVCEINLPLVNQTVKSVASTEINAMANASEKAVPLVEKYLSEHPDVKFRARSTVRHYEFFTDEFGYTGFKLNSEYRKKIGNDMLNDRLESIKVLEKAVARIAKINGTDKNLFVQIIDKSFFAKDDTIDDIQRKIRQKMLGNSSDLYIAWEITKISGNCVIVAGYIMED